MNHKMSRLYFEAHVCLCYVNCLERAINSIFPIERLVLPTESRFRDTSLILLQTSIIYSSNGQSENKDIPTHFRLHMLTHWSLSLMYSSHVCVCLFCSLFCLLVGYYIRTKLRGQKTINNKNWLSFTLFFERIWWNWPIKMIFLIWVV